MAAYCMTRRFPEFGIFKSFWNRRECKNRWLFHCRVIVIALGQNLIANTKLSALVVAGATTGHGMLC